MRRIMDASAIAMGAMLAAANLQSHIVENVGWSDLAALPRRGRQRKAAHRGKRGQHVRRRPNRNHISRRVRRAHRRAKRAA